MMGWALGLVRFPDGEIFYCNYNGTSDVMPPPLYRTRKECDAGYKQDFEWPEGEYADEETVEICSYYGGGRHWRGKASKTAMMITGYQSTHFWDEEDLECNMDEREAFYDFIQCKDGIPEWAKEIEAI